MPAQSREDLLQQDGQRPTVEHTVVAGEHKAVLVESDPDQRHPEQGRAGQIADRCAFGRTHLLDLVVDIDAADFYVLPRGFGISGDDLHRRIELWVKASREVGMSGDDRIHRVAQPLRIERTRKSEVQLHRIHIIAVGMGGGMEEQPLLQRRQRQHIGNSVLALQLVDLMLSERCGQDICRRQSPSAATHMCADTCQRLDPELAQSADLRIVHRGRPGPVGLQTRLGAGARFPNTRVQGHGMSQRQRHSSGHRGRSDGVGARQPQLAALIAGTAQPPQVVEPDNRFCPSEIHLGVQISQQTVGDAVGQRTQLLLGCLDHRTQRGIAGAHLRPVQPAKVQGHRVFTGEPPDSARQIDPCGHTGIQVLVAPMAFHVDTDRRTGVTRQLRDCQPERDQQDVAHPGVERRRGLTQQDAGGVGVHRHRHRVGGRVGVNLRLHGRQQRRGRLYPRPRLGMPSHLGGARVPIDQRRPPGEGRASRR